MKIRNRKGCNGYLLMEALLAVTVLSIGLYATLEAFALVHTARERSREDALAARCEEIGRLRQLVRAPVRDERCVER